jgi:predicted ABC-type ATPase
MSTARSGPHLILLAGPNGAGKSTLAPWLLKQGLGLLHYVNADEIAKGLAGFDPQVAAIGAGRVMLERLDELASRRVDFAVETTLSGKSLAGWITRQQEQRDYQCHIAYLWPRTPDVALERVRARVASGGHHVPESIVRRRYWRSIRNFVGLYRGLAETWTVFDNKDMGAPLLLASGVRLATTSVSRPDLWVQFCEQAQCR